MINHEEFELDLPPLPKRASRPTVEETDAKAKADRTRAANHIIRHPERFFYCEGCGSLFQRGGTIEQRGSCPHCHGYRFNYSAWDVIKQARLLRDRPRRNVLPSDYD